MIPLRRRSACDPALGRVDHLQALDARFRHIVSHHPVAFGSDLIQSTHLAKLVRVRFVMMPALARGSINVQ